MLERAAAGELLAPIGRFTMFWIGLMLILLSPLAGLAHPLAIVPSFFGAVALAVRLYQRTPPRALDAHRLLRRERRRFLAKRAPRALPAAED